MATNSEEMAMSTYPILEYDSTRSAVIEPDHENLGIELPPCVAFPFVGELVDEYAQKHDLPVLASFKLLGKDYPVYRVSEKVCLCQAPVGAPISAWFMDWLIAYGARKIVAAGTCGALVDLPENTFVVPRRALRDEGTSYHYMAPARWSYLDDHLQDAICRVLEAERLPYVEKDTWTTDAILRETVDKVRRCRAEGCGVVEMECAALSACAEFRGVAFGQLMFAGNTLADTEAFDARDWGADSLKALLSLCLEVADAESRELP